MTLFLTLAPFAAFSTLMLFGLNAAAALSGAALATAVVIFDVARGRSVKILQTGAALLFAAIGAYLLLIDIDVKRNTIAIAVDGGMLAIALVSLALRYPFSLQYAREQVDAETQATPRFLRVNYIITWIWAGAFALMLATNIATIFVPSLPLWLGLAATIVARQGATLFTQWYPKLVRAQIESQQPAAC